ncbi:PDZ domain-containing protein [Ktedonosporobacter rubrisoli]|uniref:PDZ domain-containing protein n=1 Tax=Ktedonosporobacter rubrisoli TaxID=2509675 RepID=A0A4P6JQV9_KTERU|nr:S41 family peptidase [Ktedonosporobacter rubrisoli]QBD77156.1 PDZ domain-containing protein [Ktedonosporobacter rubrisoli]
MWLGHSLKEQINWQELRCFAFKHAYDAQNTADTYPTLRKVLERLGDAHSFFIPPEEARKFLQGEQYSVGLLVVYPEGVVVQVATGSPAQRAGIRVGDRIQALNGKSVENFQHAQELYKELFAPLVKLTVKRERSPGAFFITLQAKSYPREARLRGERLASRIGYLDLPGVMNLAHLCKRYATSLHSLIRSIEQIPTQGWIIDVRRNTGGCLWPMLAGVGPILGEQASGAFMFPKGMQSTWSYSHGGTMLTSQWGKYVRRYVDKPYLLKYPATPVAILTSRLTCSSGEFVVISFRGRAQTRSFGEATHGSPTSIQRKILRDGGNLCLATAWGCDRTGQIYTKSIQPDMFVPLTGL